MIRQGDMTEFKMRRAGIRGRDPLAGQAQYNRCARAAPQPCWGLMAIYLLSAGAVLCCTYWTFGRRLLRAAGQRLDIHTMLRAHTLAYSNYRLEGVSRAQGIVRVAAYVEIADDSPLKLGESSSSLGDLETGRLNNRNFGAGDNGGKEAVGYGGNYDYFRSHQPRPKRARGGERKNDNAVQKASEDGD